jgi:hypothetical protein
MNRVQACPLTLRLMHAILAKAKGIIAHIAQVSCTAAFVIYFHVILRLGCV